MLWRAIVWVYWKQGDLLYLGTEYIVNIYYIRLYY